MTDIDGKYNLSVPGDDAVLVFSYIGFKTQEIPANAQSTLDIALAPDVNSLQEVVVVGYGTQKKSDLTSAIAVVDPQELLSVKTTSVAQQLQGRAPGVTVTSSNVPGQGANVRVRGFGTLGNNDPLYVIDGVPTKDNLANFNQNDIESIQILKDATSASIYGARAGNGVIIITTKKGAQGAPKVTLDTYYGIQTPRKLLSLLNTQEYGQYLWRSKRNAGVVSQDTGNPANGQYGNGAEPVIPDYIVPSGAFEGDPRVDPANYSNQRFFPDGTNNPAFGSEVFQITRANKEGTDWLNEIFKPAPMREIQLGVSGGSETARYSFSTGIFDQRSMLQYNGFKRYSLRANTEFTVKKKIRIGENLQVLYANRNGSFGDQAEGNEVSFAYRMQPIVPVYDIAGNFAGSLGNNLGNAKNPLARLYRFKDNGYQDFRVFGNAYAEVDLLPGLTARTSLGLDATVGRGKTAEAPDIENSEAGRFYNFRANFNYRYTWTWTNTLNYTLDLGDIHHFNITAGTEAIQGYQEFQEGFRDRYIISDPVIPQNLRYLEAGNPQFQSNNSYVQSDYALWSYFGQVNYTLMDKYLLQGTLRRDASSRFLGDNRSDVFPAISAGWRISQEEFLQGISAITDLKIRAGWGQTGNQDGINDYNSFETYDTDIYRAGYSVTGNPNGYNLAFALRKFGNPRGKWETTTSTNVGFDLGLFQQKVEVNFDWYNRLTDDILLQIQLPYALGNGDFPSFNAASVRNRGVDLGINYYETLLDGKLNLSIGGVFSTYKNAVTVIDPQNDEAFIQGFSLRTPPVTRSIKGEPISSFYGYTIDGIIQSNTAATDGAVDGVTFPGYYDATVYIDGKPQQGTGKFIYRDLDGDNVITSADQGYIGSPHPDFTYGLNLRAEYKGLELTAFLQGVQGNDVFNYVRYWTDFNTFQGNRTKDVLYNSWTPTNTNSKLPILDENDAISSRPSTYFVEDGSYARIKNLQLAYSLPESVLTSMGIGITKVRVYVQAQNLVTFTKYSGLDPELSLRDNNNNQIGVDEGVFPTPKVFLFGLNLGF